MSVAARVNEALDESLAARDENSPRLFVVLRLAARPFRPAGRGCDGGGAALFAFNLRALFGRSLRFFLRLFAPLIVPRARAQRRASPPSLCPLRAGQCRARSCRGALIEESGSPDTRLSFRALQSGAARRGARALRRAVGTPTRARRSSTGSRERARAN